MNKGYVAIIVIVILALIFFSYHGKVDQDSSVVSVAAVADQVVNDVKDGVKDASMPVAVDKKTTEVAGDAVKDAPIPASSDAKNTEVAGDAVKDAPIPASSDAKNTEVAGDAVKDGGDVSVDQGDPAKTNVGDADAPKEVPVKSDDVEPAGDVPSVS